MNRRMSGGDASLNATISADGDSTMQWQDWLEDEDADQAGDYEARDELETRREMLVEAMEVLNDREKDILTQRRLHGPDGDAGDAVGAIRRQPRADPPDRGARLREAAKEDAGTRRRPRACRNRLTPRSLKRDPPGTKLGRVLVCLGGDMAEFFAGAFSGRANFAAEHMGPAIHAARGNRLVALATSSRGQGGPVRGLLPGARRVSRLRRDAGLGRDRRGLHPAAQHAACRMDQEGAARPASTC